MSYGWCGVPAHPCVAVSNFFFFTAAAATAAPAAAASRRRKSTFLPRWQLKAVRCPVYDSVTRGPKRTAAAVLAANRCTRRAACSTRSEARAAEGGFWGAAETFWVHSKRDPAAMPRDWARNSPWRPWRRAVPAAHVGATIVAAGGIAGAGGLVARVITGALRGA